PRAGRGRDARLSRAGGARVDRLPAWRARATPLGLNGGGSGDDLPALGRAGADGGAAERLRYPRAPERDGRRAAAVRAPLPARAHAHVRAEIARHPAWSHDGADEGKTWFVDVAPIRREPRLRWAWHSPQSPITGLRASSLGIVVVGLVDSVVLDPDDGSI